MTQAVRSGMCSDSFRDAQLHVVGVQETRSRHERCISVNGWLRIHTAAHHGQGGVGLRVSLNLPCGQTSGGRELVFRAEQFRVVLSTPHHLIVRVKAEHFLALIVVTHAPIQDVEDTVYQAHWDAIACYRC